MSNSEERISKAFTTFFRDLDADRQQDIQAQSTAIKERSKLRAKHADALPRKTTRSKAL